jgi:hypothetical protein
MIALVRPRATAALLLCAASAAVFGAGLLARQSSAARADNPGQATVVVSWADPSKVAPGTSGGFDRGDGAHGTPAYQAAPGTIVELNNVSREPVLITIQTGGKNVLAPVALGASSMTLIGLPPGTYALHGAGAAGVAYHLANATLRLATATPPPSSHTSAGPTTASRTSAPAVPASSRTPPAPSSAASSAIATGLASLSPSAGTSSAELGVGGAHGSSGGGRGFGLPAAVAAVAFAGVAGALARVLLSTSFVAATSAGAAARAARPPRRPSSSHRR